MSRSTAVVSSQTRSESEQCLMFSATIEQYVADLAWRLRSGALVGLGPVTVGHGVSLGFEEAVRTTLAELDMLTLRYRRGAWLDHDRERVVCADIEHLHWLAEFRDRRR